MSARNPTGRPERGGPLGPRGLIALGAGLVALFVVVAIASRADTPLGSDSSERGEVPDFLAEYLGTFFLVAVLPFGTVLLVYAFALRAKVQTTRGRRSFARTLGLTALFVAAVSLAAVLVANRLAEWRSDSGKATTTATQGESKKEGTIDSPEFRWELAAVLYGLLAAAVLMSIAARRSRPGATGGDEDLAATLRDVLDETLDDLQAERDARRAVIAAYSRMERALTAYGLPRKPFEAPLEYLARILVELQVRAESAFDLTDLFERAKFSTQTIDEAMKEEAIAALTNVRDDLREATA